MTVFVCQVLPASGAPLEVYQAVNLDKADVDVPQLGAEVVIAKRGLLYQVFFLMINHGRIGACGVVEYCQVLPVSLHVQMFKSVPCHMSFDDGRCCKSK